MSKQTIANALAIVVSLALSFTDGLHWLVAPISWTASGGLGVWYLWKHYSDGGWTRDDTRSYRWLCGVILVGVVLQWWWFWPKAVAFDVKPLISYAVRRPGSDVGGIKWTDKYRHLVVSFRAEDEVENLEVVFRPEGLNVGVADAVELSSLPGVSLTRHGEPRFDAEAMRRATGTSVAFNEKDYGILGTTGGYMVRVPRLTKTMRLDVLMAVVAIDYGTFGKRKLGPSDPRPRVLPLVMQIGRADHRFWYWGSFDEVVNLFGVPPNVQNMTLFGTYEKNGQDFEVESTVVGVSAIGGQPIKP